MNSQFTWESMQLKLGRFREQSLIRKLVNVMGIVLLALIGLEVFLRLLGGVLLWQAQHAGTTSTEAGRPFTILCIGDSWTFGLPKGNYPYYLQKALDELDTGLEFQVLNLGAGGTNSSQHLRLLARQIPERHPDLVIMMTGNNDHHNLSESTYWKFTNQEFSAMKRWLAKVRVFFHSLRTYKLAKILYYQLAGIPTPNEFYGTTTEGEEPTTHPTAIDITTHNKQLEYNLMKCIELTRMNNIPLVFQTYFHFHGYRVNEVIADVALRFNVPLVDNNTLFHENIPVDERSFYLIADGHPSREGYQFIAENLMQVLLEEELIPQTAQQTAQSFPQR